MLRDQLWMRGSAVNDTTQSAQYSAKNVANYFLKHMEESMAFPP
ncbi:MAG: hypothetical protein OXC91_07445 [Rhodobacteraceae bacterium]|nr:hypothetical protein [Paracoccaceae bacterium]